MIQFVYDHVISVINKTENPTLIGPHRPQKYTDSEMDTDDSVLIEGCQEAIDYAKKNFEYPIEYDE